MGGLQAEAAPRAALAAVLSAKLLPASCRNPLQEPPAASSPPAPFYYLTPILGHYEHQTASVHHVACKALPLSLLLGLTLPQIAAQPHSLPARSDCCSSRCLSLSPSFKIGMQEGREEGGAEQGKSLGQGRGAGTPAPRTQTLAQLQQRLPP